MESDAKRQGVVRGDLDNEFRKTAKTPTLPHGGGSDLKMRTIELNLTQWDGFTDKGGMALREKECARDICGMVRIATKILKTGVCSNMDS